MRISDWSSDVCSSVLWRESSVFTPLARDVMEYAEAMSQTPPAVTDEMSAGLLEQLGASALIELTAMIGYANLAARTNTALGIESEGLSRVCKLPDRKTVVPGKSVSVRVDLVGRRVLKKTKTNNSSNN